MIERKVIIFSNLKKHQEDAILLSDAVYDNHGILVRIHDICDLWNGKLKEAENEIRISPKQTIAICLNMGLQENIAAKLIKESTGLPVLKFSIGTAISVENAVVSILKTLNLQKERR